MESTEPAREPTLIQRLALAFAQPEQPGGRPSADLLQVGPEFAALYLLKSGVPVVLLAYDPDPARAKLRLDDALARLQRGELHVVIVGGSASAVDDLLRTSAPSSLGRSFSFHQVDQAGAPRRISGKTLPGFQEAVRRALSGDPIPSLTPEELLRWQAIFAKERAEELSFAGELKRRPPKATLVLVGICVALYALGLFWGGGGIHSLFRMGANLGNAFRAGEWWRPLSAVFLHASPAHLAFNMLALFSIGYLLEPILGRSRFLVLFALSALGGGLASATLNPETLSIGASGAVWGLMAAQVALILKPGKLLPQRMQARLRNQVWTPVAANVFISFMPQVDKWAHFGGGLVGLALLFSGALTRGLAPLGTPPEALPARRPSPLPAILAALLTAVLAASVGMALSHGRPWELREPPAFERVAVPGTGISLELPKGLSLASEPIEGGVVATFGDALRDPLVVVVTAVRADGLSDPQEREEGFAALERQLPDLAKAEGLDKPGAPRRGGAGGRPAVILDGSADGASVRGTYWGFVLDRHLVVIRSFGRTSGAEAWKGAPGRVAASVQEAQPPAP